MEALTEGLYIGLILAALIGKYVPSQTSNPISITEEL